MDAYHLATCVTNAAHTRDGRHENIDCNSRLATKKKGKKQQKVNKRDQDALNELKRKKHTCTGLTDSQQTIHS